MEALSAVRLVCQRSSGGSTEEDHATHLVNSATAADCTRLFVSQLVAFIDFRRNPVSVKQHRKQHHCLTGSIVAGISAEGVQDDWWPWSHRSAEVHPVPRLSIHCTHASPTVGKPESLHQGPWVA